MGRTKQGVQSLLPTKSASVDDVVFFAGFYEGEGSCSTNGTSLNAVIPQKDPEMLYKARDFWGGSVRKYKIWQWTLCGNRARQFLQSIYPYLSARRKSQIDKVTDFKLTNAHIRKRTGMSPERIALRSSMTPEERLKETKRNWFYLNREHGNYRSRMYAKEHREQRNEYQRNRRRMLAELSKQNPVAKESIQ